MENRLIEHEALCISDGKLVEYKEGSMPAGEVGAVSSHLALCDACLMRLEFLPDSLAEYAARVKAIDEDSSPTPVPDSLRKAVGDFKARAAVIRSRKVRLGEVLGGGGLRAGQLWRPRSKDVIVPTAEWEERNSVFDLGSKPCFVLIAGDDAEELGGYHVVRVVVVSTDTDAGRLGEGDLLVEDERLLAHPFIIQGWNRTEMLRENLEYCVGDIRDVVSEAEYAELLNDSPGSRTADHYSLEAVIRRGAYSDPLARYRARAFEEAAYLRFPVESLRRSVDEEETYAIDPEVEELLRGLPFAVIQTGFTSRGVGVMADKPEGNTQIFSIDGTTLTGATARDADGMWLRIQTDDKNWDGAVITFAWEPHSVKSAAGRRFMVLSRDDISFDAYVAEINLGEPDAIELRPTVVPLPPNGLTIQMAEYIKKSISDARTPRDLRAWRRLVGEHSLPSTVKEIIEEALSFSGA